MPAGILFWRRFCWLWRALTYISSIKSASRLGSKVFFFYCVFTNIWSLFSKKSIILQLNLLKSVNCTVCVQNICITWVSMNWPTINSRWYAPNGTKILEDIQEIKISNYSRKSILFTLKELFIMMRRTIQVSDTKNELAVLPNIPVYKKIGKMSLIETVLE